MRITAHRPILHLVGNPRPTLKIERVQAVLPVHSLNSEDPFEALYVSKIHQKK
jgi:hypothetical protein